MNFLKFQNSIFLRSTPAADHRNNVLKNDVDSGICLNKTSMMLFSGSLTLLQKAVNGPFRHFELNVDSEAKFRLVHKSDK